MFWSVSSKIKNWLPYLQCHRGWWVEGLQQNSQASIKMAFERGYNIVEFDIRLTKDREIILFHDNSFENRLVSDYTYLQLKTAALSKYPQLDTLKNFLSWFSEYRQQYVERGLKLNIEIKSAKIFDSFLEIETCRLIKKFQLVDHVLISSFNPFTLFKIRIFSRKIFRALLLSFENEPWNKWFLKKMIFNFLARPHILHLRWQDLNNGLMNLEKMPVPIVLWTVNHVDELLFANNKICGIITDQLTPDILSK